MTAIVALLKNFMVILNFSYTEGYLCDTLRKCFGYVPVLWTLIDDFYGPELAVKTIGDLKKGNKNHKTCVSGMWTKIMLNPARYLIFVDLFISCLTDQVLTLLAMAFAVSIAFTAWMKFGGAQWTAASYLSFVFPGMKRAGPLELRFLILMLSTLCSALCFAIKFESTKLSIVSLIGFYALYGFVGEKGFTVALGVLTFNWPILLLAMIEKYPMTSSLRGSFNFVNKK